MYHYGTATNPTRSSFSEHAAVHLKQRHNDAQIVANNCQVLTKCSNTDDFRRIEQLVHMTFPICRIDKISQINHRHMYGMYLLRKEEMQLKYYRSIIEVKELMLFHVTTEERGSQSLESGLDWRRTKRSRFGRGVSFSDDADYADFYANFHNSNSEDKRVIIVCSVLVAKKFVTKPNSGYTLDIPPKTYDTTVSPNGRVYVKYEDYEFYPLYMVYYQRRPEDLCQSRYFKANKQQNPKRPTVSLQRNCVLQSQSDQQRRQEELRAQQQLQQRRQAELQRQYQQRRQEELQRQQNQQHTYNYNNRQQQFHSQRQQENNACLIL